ncbi:MAG: hypothetical protein M3O50_16480 [Myxococcota bacterium]|nr:hypothetical protein [Myxococcota bacterium]
MVSLSCPCAPAVAGLLSIGVLGAVSGCGPSPSADSVGANVLLIDRTSQALSTGALTYANGTYSGCVSKAGSWSAFISGDGGMEYPALKVVKNDVNCALILTELVSTFDYRTSPSITLATTYAGSQSAFLLDPEDGGASTSGVAFYANAKASGIGAFGADFTITVLLSDDLGAASPAATATYVAVTATAPGDAGATATVVPSPNYTVGFGDLSIQTDVGQVVQTASGTVALNAGTQAGELYVIDSNQSLGSNFDSIDTAYGAGTPVAVAPTLLVGAFSLPTAQLPTVRNVIIVHTANYVRAYEVIRITFTATTM